MNNSQIAVLLQREFQNIASYFSRAKELKNHFVSFEIADLKSVWGQYDPTSKVIRLNKKLIDAYSWWNVVGVLKHELAHHLVHVRSSSRSGWHQPPHGIEFQKACDDLGVPHFFRGAGVDLDLESTWTPRGSNLENLGISDFGANKTSHGHIEKIKKLMSLACSDNENEAKLAAEKIQVLLIKNQIELAEVTGDNVIHENLIIEFGTKRVPLYIKQIVQILVEHFFVFAVFQPSKKVSPTGVGEITIVELMGRPENLSMAEYVFYFLKEQVEVELKLRRKKGSNRVESKSFAWGYLEGFSEQMRAQQKPILDQEHVMKRTILANDKVVNHKTLVPIQAKDLVAVSKQQLELYVNLMFPRLRNSGSRQKFDATSYNQGRKAGSELRLKRAIKEKSSRIGQLLGFSLKT